MRLQHLRGFLVYIAAVKPSRFLLAVAVLTLSLHAADEQSVAVKSNLIENSVLMVIADLEGKPTELDCQISHSSCSQPQPGEYSMRPATADEAIYEDCTNVVLLKSSGAAKEKIGVYCWANASDCYIVSCSVQWVETIPAVVPDTALESTLAQQASKGTDVLVDLPQRPSFSDYPVKETFRGKSAPPKLVTEGDRAFRTRIRYGAKLPVEFAGHYTLPRWGCGAGCNDFVIVDSVTGRVYDVPFSLVDLPDSWVEKHAYEPHDRMAFRTESRLMKLDACLNETDCGLYDYVMVDGKGLKLIRKELLPREFQPAQ